MSKEKNIIVIASNNLGKLRELAALMKGLDVELHPQSDFNVPEAEETGLTFVENAILKARNAAKVSGHPAIADDSGIEIDYLNGAPGIYSARFSGLNATETENNQKLLDELKGVPEARRTAHYFSSIVYMRHAEDPAPIIAEGTWEGVILTEPRGEGGFGYDPLFYLPEHGCASAELSAEYKNRISHRGIALRELMEKLEPTLEHDREIEKKLDLKTS